MGEHSEFWLSLYICTYLKLMRTSFVYVSTTDNPGVLVYSLVLHTVKLKKKNNKERQIIYPHQAYTYSEICQWFL